MKTVVIVDDSVEIRGSVRRLLTLIPGVAVVGEASDGEAAFDVVLRQHPDIVLMDVSMPRMNGFEATARIHSQAPGVCIVFVTAHLGAEFVRRAFEVGAVGYVVKSAAAAELPAAIDAVTRGQQFVSALIEGHVAKWTSESRNVESARGSRPQATPRVDHRRMYR